MNISVVTINLNKRAGLRRTLASLRGQTDRAFESIVVDGGSTDGSQDEIARFDDVVTSATSERDSGIYEAWNRGIARATGRVIALLNSGDAYHPDVIATLAARVTADRDAARKVFSGHTVTVENGKLLKSYGNRLRSNLWFGIGIVHPAMFVGREVYDAVGQYAPISIASDTDFVLRCVRRGVEFAPLEALVYMEAGGVSVQHAVKAFRQYTESLARHGFCGTATATALGHAYGAYKGMRRAFR
jgi:glycosyltransferase involved in cell wall biosynthesis